jgi:hypothetical protein
MNLILGWLRTLRRKDPPRRKRTQLRLEVLDSRILPSGLPLNPTAAEAHPTSVLGGLGGFYNPDPTLESGTPTSGNYPGNGITGGDPNPGQGVYPGNGITGAGGNGSSTTGISTTSSSPTSSSTIGSGTVGSSNTSSSTTGTAIASSLGTTTTATTGAGGLGGLYNPDPGLESGTPTSGNYPGNGITGGDPNPGQGVYPGNGISGTGSTGTGTGSTSTLSHNPTKTTGTGTSNNNFWLSGFQLASLSPSFFGPFVGGLSQVQFQVPSSTQNPAPVGHALDSLFATLFVRVNPTAIYGGTGWIAETPRTPTTTDAGNATTTGDGQNKGDGGMKVEPGKVGAEGGAQPSGNDNARGTEGPFGGLFEMDGLLDFTSPSNTTVQLEHDASLPFVDSVPVNEAAINQPSTTPPSKAITTFGLLALFGAVYVGIGPRVNREEGSEEKLLGV